MTSFYPRSAVEQSWEGCFWLELAALLSRSPPSLNTRSPSKPLSRPAGEVRIVQAATQGTVKSISVKENQVVKKGEEIATIDDSRLQTQKSQLQGNIQQGKLLLTQINVQISALDSQVLAEFSLMNRTIVSATADLSRNQREHTERQITTQTQVQEAEAGLELAREEMKRYQQLAETGAIAFLQVKEKEQAFIAAQARLERAKATLNRSAAPVAIATERIAQERAKGSATLATLNKELERLVQRRIEIQNLISREETVLIYSQKGSAANKFVV